MDFIVALQQNGEAIQKTTSKVGIYMESPGQTFLGLRCLIYLCVCYLVHNQYILGVADEKLLTW